MVAALDAVRRGEGVLVLVFPEGSRALFRPLVQRPADRSLDVLAAVVQGEDLRIGPDACMFERPFRDAGVVRVLLRGLGDLDEALDCLVGLREVFDVARENPFLVYEENRGRRLPPAVADYGLVLREADLVGAVRDDVRDRVLATERDRLLDDSGSEVFHGITSGTRSAAESSARRGSRRAPGPGRISHRSRPRSRGPSRPRRRPTRKPAS